MEVLSRGRAVDDAYVLLRRELEEALELCARVLRAVALVAVREEQRQPGGLAPLGEPRDDELVDDHFGGIREVTELRFPEHQHFGGRSGIAVLEPKARELGKRAVVQLERREGTRELLDRDVLDAGLLVV